MTALNDLGAAIAVGRTAEVFAYGEGRVLKLLMLGFPARLGEQEARVAEIVALVYPNAPRCLGTTLIEGRFGLIYERIVGPSMDERLRRKLWQVARLGRALGELHAEMHLASGAGLPDQRSGFRAAIERATPDLPARARDAALARLDRLPGGTAVCHGDLHPGNVILGPDRPAVIDWDNASCGNPVADVARALHLTRDTPIREPWIQRPLVRALRHRFADAYLARYRELRPLDEKELREWRLPILAARMAEGIVEERSLLQARLTRELEPR